MAAGPRFCTFYLAGLWFGVEVERVQEVVRPPVITLVPRAPTAVAGLIHLRGQILTVIDLRRCLGLPECPAESSPLNLIVLSQSHGIGFLVDRVGDVVGAPEDAYEPPPETLPPRPRELLRGVYKFPGRILHALAIDAVVSHLGYGTAPPGSLKDFQRSSDGLQRGEFSVREEMCPCAKGRQS